MSKKLDQISDANILKTDFKTQNQFSNALGNVGSSQNKNLLNYVKELFKQYINDRYKGKESDVYLINKELIKRFKDDFSNFITEYQKDIDTNIDLDKILKDISIKEHVDDKIIAEIKTIITSVLKQKLKEHINNQTGNTEKITEIKGIIKKYQLQTLNSREIENIINGVLTDAHPIIKQIKSEFKDTIKAVNLKHNVPSIKNVNIFKSKKLNKIVNKSANKLSQKTFTIFNYKKKPPKIIDSIGMKFLIGTVKIVKKCKDIISKFISVTGKILNFIGKIYKFVKRLVVVLGMITKLITGIIFNLIKFVIIKPINFLIIKPLKFMVSKIFSLVGLVAKTVFKIIPLSLNLIKKVLSLVSNTLKMTLKASKFILFTPQGMYALGFLLGFLWNKIEQMIPKLKIPKLISDEEIDKLIPDDIFNLETIFKFVDGVYDIFENIYCNINEFGLKLENKYPIIKKIRHNINHFFDNIQHKGLIETFKELTIVKNMIDLYKNSSLFSVIEFAIDTTLKFGQWIYENQEFAEFLLGIRTATLFSSSAFNLLQKFKLTKTGGFLPGLLGAISSFVSYKTTDAIMNMFPEAKEIDGDGLVLQFSKTKKRAQKAQDLFHLLYVDTGGSFGELEDTISNDMHTLQELIYAYNICNELENRGDIDKKTIFSNYPIYDMNNTLEVLYKKYMGKDISVGEKFIDNIKYTNEIIAKITNLYEQLTSGDRNKISSMIKNSTDVNQLITDLLASIGNFEYKYNRETNSTFSQGTGEFPIQKRTDVTTERESIKAILPDEKKSIIKPIGKVYLASPGNISDELWNIMISKGVLPNNTNGRKIFQTLLSNISEERLYGKDGILKNMDVSKERYRTRTIISDNVFSLTGFVEMSKDISDWEGNFEVEIDEPKLVKTIKATNEVLEKKLKAKDIENIESLINYLTTLFKIANEKMKKIPNELKSSPRYKKIIEDFNKLKVNFETIKNNYNK